MSQATTPTTGSTPSGPQRQAGPQGARPRAAPTIDPVRILRQHAWLLAGSAVAGAVLGVITHFAQLFIYPVWSGSVTFEINPQVTDASKATAVDFAVEEQVSRIGQTESRRLVIKTVLDAAMKAPDIDATSWGKEYPTVDERVQELEDTLKVGHIRGTANFALSWSTQSKEDVPVVLNRIAETYMKMRRAEDDERAARSLSQFEEKRRNLDEEIRRQTEAMTAFMAKNQVSAIESVHSELHNKIENTAHMRDEAIQDLTSLKARLILVDAKIEQGTYEEQDRRQALEDFAVQQLGREHQMIQVALQVAEQRYGPEHPERKKLTRQEQAASERYEQAVRELMQRNLMADKLAFSQRIGSLEAVVKKQTEDLTDMERKLQELTVRITELDGLRKHLDQAQEERKEVQSLITQIELLRVREDTQRVKLRQLAVTPRELSFPKLQYYIPLGAVLVMGLVAGFIFLREFLDQRVKQPSDLLGIGGCRLLGVVPDLSDDPSSPPRAERVVSEHPKSIVAEMFRQVASQARKGVDAGKFRIIAVVAAHPEAGTTTLVSNLATSAASAGRRTAVVDANFRRPRLAEVFGLDPNAPGLGNLLMGQEVKPQVVDGVAVYGAGPVETRIFERLSGDAIARALTKLREEYDLVLVDLPPTLVAGEALVIVHASDASLLVVRAMQDQRGLIGKVVGQLLDTRAALLGSVLMRPLHTAGGYFKKNAELMAEYAQDKKAT